MTRVTLDSKVEQYFRLLNSRRKCEFLAYFPSEGITQKELAEAEAFNHHNKSMIHWYLQPYRPFLNIPEKADAQGYKTMTLNEEGGDLQRVARYMILINEEIKNTFKTKIDYLGLFLEKGSPKRLLEILKQIYSSGADQMKKKDLCRWIWDRDTNELVKRLESFDLIKTKLETRKKGHPKIIIKTKAGSSYYNRLISPVIEYISATYIKQNTRLMGYLNKNGWMNHTKRNGNGWVAKLKSS